jgi:uncharacterized protein
MAADEIGIEVVYAAAPHRLARVSLRLPAGATVSQAIRASGIVDQVPVDELARLEAGVWGRLAPGDKQLRDGDRVELTRPLQVDPKEARRLRYRRDAPDKRRAPVSGTRSR